MVCIGTSATLLLVDIVTVELLVSNEQTLPEDNYKFSVGVYVNFTMEN